MPETIEQFFKKWQTLLAIILAAGVGYGMKSVEITTLSNELEEVKEELRVVRSIELRMERLETNQKNTYELLQEIRRESK